MSDFSDANSDGLGPYLIGVIVFTTVMSIGAGIFFSGAGDDMAQWVFEKFFKAKAKAEEKALEHVGEEKARGFL